MSKRIGDGTITILKGGVGSGHHGHSGRPGKVGGSSPGGGGSLSNMSDDERMVTGLFAAALSFEDEGNNDSRWSMFRAALDTAQNKGVDPNKVNKLMDVAKVQNEKGYAKKLGTLKGLAGTNGNINVFDLKKTNITQSDRRKLLGKGYIEQVNVRNFRITDAGRNNMEEYS